MSKFQNWLESNYDCDDLNKSEIEIAREAYIEAYKAASKAKVWIVIGEDRGLGPSIGGVFSSLKAAQTWIEDLGSSRYSIYDEDGEVVYN